MKVVFRAARQAWKPADRRPPWKWNEENRRADPTSPWQGKWRSDTAPWVREPMECFADSSVNEISTMCSAQSSKTDMIIGCLFYAVSEDPGPVQWVMAAADEAQTFVRTRLAPSIMECDKVFALLNNDPDQITAREINFPGSPVLITGANSKSKLQSNPKRYLFLDEVRNYPPGAYEMVRKRVRAFWNQKIIVISTPDRTNDHVHRAFLQGDQRHYHVPCPHCGQLQKLQFKQLKWDENETTRPGGRWNFDRVAETVRYECVACAKPIKDEPAVRKALAAAGKWVKENPHAAANRVSFHWNALLPPWVKWRDIVEEFLNAHHALKLGDPEPYKAFINETLGEPWEDRLGEVRDWGALEARRRTYPLGEWVDDGAGGKKINFEWKEEITAQRLLGIDKQRDHYRYVCRAVGPYGETRLVSFGRIDTEAELETLPLKLGVDNANVMVDSGHEAASVYRMCAKNRWKAMKGSSADGFAAAEADDDGKKLKQIWTLTYIDPAIGTEKQGRVKPVKLYVWSNDRAKDMLAEWMKGLGPEWTLPADTTKQMQDYLDQLTAEKRVEKVDAKGRSSFDWVQVRRDNHYWDCELMILVALVIKKLVGATDLPTVEEEAEKIEASSPPPGVN